MSAGSPKDWQGANSKPPPPTAPVTRRVREGDAQPYRPNHSSWAFQAAAASFISSHPSPSSVLSAGIVILHAIDLGDDRVSAHALSPEGPEQRRLLVLVAALFAKPLRPSLARNDHRHSIADRRHELIGLAGDDVGRPNQFRALAGGAVMALAEEVLDKRAEIVGVARVL
jgi:hypothetical protein